MGRYAKNYTEQQILNIVKSYLIDGKSYRKIERELLNKPVTSKVYGYIAMDILKGFGIYADKKGILKDLDFERELLTYESLISKIKYLRENEKRFKEEEKEKYTIIIENTVTEIKTEITQRIGQDKLRKAVLNNYNNKCAICGLSHTDLLNCSHIVPWSMDESNRLNPENAICLCAMHDRLFDRGYFSLDENYDIVFSDKADAEIKKMFSNTTFRQPKQAKPNIEFLKIHYEEICNKK
ncbi:MAG: HNH endonuclease [Tissierellales bacterium]|jgi:putative restriction endonuclease|nr:HNH endonuclease [Tissierellales bacterium]